uniref:Uncharacterized protein n=1 Tax=Panagrolaimus sp. ES5 TaxID=591445 RepID=A0AC34GAL6_9BILA
MSSASIDSINQLRQEKAKLEQAILFENLTHESLKASHRRWVQEKKEHCHALAATLCKRDRDAGRNLQYNGLAGYIPSASLDLNISQLQQEYSQALVALKRVGDDLRHFPKQYQRTVDAITFYASLHNIVWQEVQYEKIVGHGHQNVPVMNFHDPNGYGGVESRRYINFDNSELSNVYNGYEEPEPPLVYPNLPETNVFKPFRAAKKNDRQYNVS